MTAYIIRRLLGIFPVLLIVSMVTFALLYILPGDPVLAMLGDQQVDASVYEAMRKEMGLDDPLYLQYARWLWDLFQGNLGMSLNKLPVSDLIGDKLTVSAIVGLAGLLVSLAIGLPMALLSALYQGKFIDTLATLIAICGAAMPAFWLAALLIYFFGVQWPLLPVSGYVPFSEDPWLHLQLLVMPACSLGLRSAAIIMRQGRAALVSAMKQDYITTARAKGLRERTVVYRHAIKNAIGPLITILGMQLGALMSGAVITETVFAIPGVGLMAVDAIFSRDLVVLQAAVLLLTLAAIIGNLLADIAYGLIDPRVRYA